VEPPEPPTNNTCLVTTRSGANPWYVGFDLATDADSVTVDFTGTGIELGNNASLQSGVFNVAISGQILTFTKPAWVSSRNGGYFAVSGNNNPAFLTFSMPTCET